MNDCDFAHCRNNKEGCCIRSVKAYETCNYTFFKNMYNVQMNRKDRLMEQLIELVKQGELNTQQYAKLIRRELQKRNNKQLEVELKNLEETGRLPRRRLNELRNAVQKQTDRQH